MRGCWQLGRRFLRQGMNLAPLASGTGHWSHETGFSAIEWQRGWIIGWPSRVDVIAWRQGARLACRGLPPDSIWTEFLSLASHVRPLGIVQV